MPQKILNKIIILYRYIKNKIIIIGLYYELYFYIFLLGGDIKYIKNSNNLNCINKIKNLYDRLYIRVYIWSKNLYEDSVKYNNRNKNDSICYIKIPKSIIKLIKYIFQLIKKGLDEIGPFEKYRINYGRKKKFIVKFF